MDCEVIVVGAGPAGCTAARELGKSRRVLLIDSKDLPRRKPCGGALNPYSWNFLRRFGVPERIMVEPKTLRFRFVDRDRRISRKTALEFKNVDRDGLDEWLLSLLPDSVSVLDGANLLDLRETSGRVIASVLRKGRVEEIAARFVIGADGSGSRTRSAIDSELAKYIAVQEWVENAYAGSADPGHFFDCIGTSKISSDFIYGYVMPKGDSVVIGSVFYPKATGVREKHDRFASLVRREYSLKGKSTRREAALAVCVTSMRDICLGKGRILLVGEAAGFISPTSGEGISYALSSGEAAAKALLSGGEALDVYREFSAPIVRNIRSKMRKLPILENRYLRRLINITPAPILSRITTRL